MTSHFIVCGMGHVGYRVVRLLVRLREAVTVVTLESRDEWKREVEGLGVRVLIGDARDAQRLLDAGVREAAALIVATDRDLANVEIALDARQLRPDLPIVVRLFDPGLAQQLEASFDIRRAFGMSSLAAPSFAAAALGDPILGSFTLDDRLWVVGRLEVKSDAPLKEMTPHGLAQRFQVAVLGQNDLPQQRP